MLYRFLIGGTTVLLFAAADVPRPKRFAECTDGDLLRAVPSKSSISRVARIGGILTRMVAAPRPVVRPWQLPNMLHVPASIRAERY